MKKLILAVIIAIGCLNNATIQAAAAAAAGANAEGKKAEETIESVANQLNNWTKAKVPKEEILDFIYWIQGYSSYLLQLQVGDPFDKKSDLGKKINALADELKADALKAIPKKMHTIFYVEFRREFYKSPLIEHYGFINYLKAYEILRALSIRISEDLSADAIKKARDVK